MEIQQVGNQSIQNIQSGNTDTSSVQKLSTVDKIAELNSKSVNVDVNENVMQKRSNVASAIKDQLKEMAQVGTIEKMATTQVTTLDKIKETTDALKNEEVSQEDVQPNLADLMSKYNVTAGTMNEKIAKQEDLKGNSNTYFDGGAGAMPLDIDMIDNAVADKRTELKTTLEKVSEVNDGFKQKAQKVIDTEVQKTEDSSPFKAIDFGKESSDFSGTAISAMMGSVAASQANANQANNIRLLS